MSQLPISDEDLLRSWAHVSTEELERLVATPNYGAVPKAEHERSVAIRRRVLALRAA